MMLTLESLASQHDLIADHVVPEYRLEDWSGEQKLGGGGGGGQRKPGHIIRPR